MTSFVGGHASAQESEPELPVYIVQAGDTLYSIAIRFGLTLDELVSANGISNPNAISVGARLELPGVDWVSGELKKSSVPLGENLRSLVRRYQSDAQVIARLNGIVSPQQLAAGYPLLIPDNGNQNWQMARHAVGSETSLLEIAVITNSNPWSIKTANRLAGTWDLMVGDILFLPGTDDPGPGALPSPISQVSFDGERLVQGKTAVFRVSANGLAIQLSGSFLDQNLNFFEDTAGNYVALQGMHVMSEPGQYPLSIQGQTQEGANFDFKQKVLLSLGGYTYEDINVDNDLLDAEVTDDETSYINNIISEINDEQYWQGIFTAPSPYVGQYNSYFGTRRSFNGSAYIYYHGGLDYKGGLGVRVFAPAAGQIVFAGPLTIRGYATVIDHGRGVFTGYWHQSEIHVEVGDMVDQGQIIGLVGNTGRSTGPHLHWELWVGNIQVDPIDWLKIEYP